MRSITAVLFIALFAPVASANFVVNGSFEADGEVSNATTITGWTVVAGNVDTRPGLNGGSIATDGRLLLDLEGVAAGTITQTIAGLIVGQAYQFSFDLGANSSNTFLRFTLTGGASIDETIPALAGPLVSVSRNFVATSSSATITFIDAGGSGGNAGPALDNVRLVPGPGAFSMLAATLIVSRRRRG